ncbi:MAG: hypothetical protein JJ974_01660 [Phycisphaerales bacterium]|nr:hypothetical protein [Phycisphaerales bacterium]
MLGIHTNHSTSRRSRNASVLAVLSCVLLITLMVPSSGCIQRIWERDEDAALRMQSAPLMSVRELDGRKLLVMQAPSPGWSIRIDATDRTPEGKRVFVTIRRPDPAFQYTQQIVLMRALTSVRSGTDIEVVGRLLEHNEKTKNKGYAKVDLVESFEE